MFTGLVSDVGTVISRTITPAGGRFTIRAAYDAATILVGASICHDGCCLTATSVTADGPGRSRFTVDVSNETFGVTTLGLWQPGRRINLERALALGAELGGHLVTGHVDGLARVVSRTPDSSSVRLVLETTPGLARFIAAKGSVALDGTSLTVNEVEGCRFGINLIPHTLQATTWGDRATGDQVNLEVDLLARYVARLRDTDAVRAAPQRPPADDDQA